MTRRGASASCCCCGALNSLPVASTAIAYASITGTASIPFFPPMHILWNDLPLVWMIHLPSLLLEMYIFLIFDFFLFFLCLWKPAVTLDEMVSLSMGLIVESRVIRNKLFGLHIDVVATLYATSDSRILKGRSKKDFMNSRWLYTARHSVLNETIKAGFILLNSAMQCYWILESHH